MNLSTIVSRGILFSIIWWILADGDESSWWIGVPAVLLAVLVSRAIVPPLQLVWYEVLKFIPVFLLRSLLGGVDVAWRAFHPQLPISPHLITYPLRLPSGLPQVFMANTVSLLPGTLSAELEDTKLRVHRLSGEEDSFSDLEDLEQRVARIFGISLINSSESK